MAIKKYKVTVRCPVCKKSYTGESYVAERYAKSVANTKKMACERKHMQSK